jgi:hypothetical protein
METRELEPLELRVKKPYDLARQVLLPWQGGAQMKMLLMAWMVSAGLLIAAPADEKPGPSDGSQKKADPKSQKSNRQARESLTGCVDEQDGKYVLLDDRMLNKLANLETSVASAEDFFARFVGHKVVVKGSKASGQETVFKVTGIEDVAAVCSPAPGSNQ